MDASWAYQTKNQTKNEWVCHDFEERSLLNDPEEGLSARISSINSAATGEKADTSSRVHIKADGIELCSRRSNANKTLFMKAKGANDATPLFDKIQFRSFDDMVYFVGETLRTTTDGKNNKMCVENCFEDDDLKIIGDEKRYLFNVESGINLRGHHGVKVNHAGKDYYALKAGLRLKPGFVDRTGTVLAILSQILLLNQSEAFLEAPDNILLQ